MKIDLGRVIRFAVVAEHESFTRAARVLGVDQPWLSRQIKQLEDRMGFALFERTTRHIQLTPLGREFLKQAQEVAAVAERTEILAQSLARGLTRQIRVGVLTTSFWAQGRHDLIGLFEKRNPRATFEIVMGLTSKLCRALKQRDLDIVVGATMEDDPELDRLLLQRSTPRLLIPAEHPLAIKPLIYMVDLQDCPLAALDRKINPMTIEKMYGAFRDAGMVLRPVLEGKMAIPHYAHRERLFMLSYGDDDELMSRQTFVCRDIVNCTATVELWAYKNASDDRDVMRRLWNLSRLVAESAAEADRKPQLSRRVAEQV